jgi:hypothetical protein
MSMLSLRARIYLRTEAEGGMNRLFYSGMQPSFNVDGDLIMSQVFEAQGQLTMPPGAWYEVRIDLPYGDEVFIGSRVATLTSGQEFRLQVASQILADGVILGVAGDDPPIPTP